MSTRSIGSWLLLGALALGCGKRDASEAAEATPSKVAPRTTDDASPLTVAFLREHTQALSDDAMQGRRPGTPGGAKAVEYIEAQMKALGLEPAGEDGGYRQAVRMRAIRLDPVRSFATVHPGKGEALSLRQGDEIMLDSVAAAGTNRVDAELVFLGYGITAPEYDWDDYGDIDLRGQVAVVFVGDPPLDDGRFEGPAMTYYGRWTYKLERALEAGASGCLIIHETEPASYDWEVVRHSWSGERFDLVEPDGELPPHLDVQGWIHRDLATRLAALDGHDLARWHAMALQSDFEARPLSHRIEAQVVTTERSFTDYNVIGRVPGRARADEHVVITAHWDHLGVDPRAAAGEDAIFNGAVDNASGIAAVLGIGAALRAEATRGQGPDRSVLVLATTAEEQGLLGSRHYAAHPLVAAESIVAATNLDSMNVHGRSTTVIVPGIRGRSSLEQVLGEVARTQGRTLADDEHPEAGGFYRSDQLSFARRGVPAITFRGGPALEEGGLEAGRALEHEYAARYHSVEDEYDPRWSFEGALQDAQAMLELVRRVADAEARPTWAEGSEFADRGSPG